MLAAITTLVGAILALSTKGGGVFLETKDSKFAVILISTLVPAFAIVLLRYLTKFTSLSDRDFEHEMFLCYESTLDKADKDEMIASLKRQIETRATDELLSSIHSSLEKRFLTSHHDSTVSRLTSEIRALTGRGNINLVIGICTAIVGLGILGYVVFSQAPQQPDFQASLMHYLPRLGLAFCIELFAYFFLRLYKTSLQDIKYFQNELTNIEMRTMALMAALQGGDAPTTSRCIEALSQTERNPSSGSSSEPNTIPAKT